MANIMIRKGANGYVFYMPKRGIEDSITSMEFDSPEKWGGGDQARQRRRVFHRTPGRSGTFAVLGAGKTNRWRRMNL